MRSCPRYQQVTEGDSMTEQQHKESCDVNYILKRFEQTGVMEHINTLKPRYEYASAQTFDEAARLMTSAQQEFDQLPASVRLHFNNNVPTFLDAIQDPSQVETLQTLGLLPKTPEISPEHTSRVSDTPPVQTETPKSPDSPPT